MVSDERFDAASVAEITQPNRSCLVVTRPQRRQAPGHDDGFDSRVRAVVMTFITQYYGISHSPSG
jgi:hypothetical protein